MKEPAAAVGEVDHLLSLLATLSQDLQPKLAQELRERGEGTGGYSRWNWMAPAIAIMARISPDHGAALARTYAEVLAEYPLSADERRAARHQLRD